MTLIIEMVSDLVCPWCWIGKRRIETAIAQVPELDVQLLFRPFELDANVPKDGLDYKDYMLRKFGSGDGKTRVNAMRDMLIEYGEAENVPYRFENVTRRPNSFDAHRLVRWAQGQDKGADAKEALFKAYFNQGRDIGHHDVLTEIAAEINIDSSIVKDLLASDADNEAVREEITLFQQMGVSGVPTFIAGRSHAVSGAQEVETLVQLMRTAAVQTA